MIDIPFAPPTLQATITVDASLTGWGANLHQHTGQGVWSPQEARTYVNVLELWADWLAFQTFLPLV